jgi:hypothetical protein
MNVPTQRAEVHAEAPIRRCTPTSPNPKRTPSLIAKKSVISIGDTTKSGRKQSVGSIRFGGLRRRRIRCLCSKRKTFFGHHQEYYGTTSPTA